ncbi:histone deacetylase family protein [Teredinibacter franksiae]|uniref:histone deacetylase family protein n=1 Tax=Teredinibacter franksiae TaxID=2761453 RepID=UPI001628CFB3|nr:histone deacetylase family protein [Teredinibacter franksiae]
MPVTAYLTHPVCLQHDMGAGHPECPQRLSAINDALVHARVMDFLRCREAKPVEVHQLKRVHTRDYIASVHSAAPAEGMIALDSDISMNQYSLEAAQMAAGAAVQAVDLVMHGEADNAFCAVRPPGHHAERERAMGFCIFNNIAVAAAHALEHYGLERVAIVDFDVHHGNGSEDIFKNEPRVMLCSSFQHPFYPYSCGPSAEGHLVNVRLPAGTDSETFRAALEEQWFPQLRRFKPQMIFISAGFDAHRRDPLAQLNLLEADYSWVTREIKKLAEQCCEGRIVSSLEGGYDLQALGTSVVAHIKVLSGLE